VKAKDKLNTITTLQKHLFVADWQNKQFENCKSHIQHGDVLAVYDFAQNYTTMNQDAIKLDRYAKKTNISIPDPMLLPTRWSTEKGVNNYAVR